MRIIIYQDYLRSGGTESQTLFLAERFIEKGDDVRVLTNRPGGRLEARLKESSAKISLVSLQTKDLGLNWYAPKLKARIAEFRPDVILLMGRNANAKGAFFRKKFPDTKIIATVRTGRSFTPGYKRTLKQPLLVVCNSAWAAERIKEMGIPDERVTVHRNPCVRANELNEVKSKSYAEKADKSGVSRDPMLLFVAAFVKGKNHRGLLEIFAAALTAIPNLKLRLVGEGPLKLEIEKQAEQMGLGDAIEFLGYQESLKLIFDEADLVVSSSVEESLPNALIEAQYAGLPVIAYDVAGVKECFIPDKTGILIPTNEKEHFAQKMIEVLSEPEMLETMSLKAREFAVTAFNPDLMFDGFYKTVLKYCE